MCEQGLVRAAPIRMAVWQHLRAIGEVAEHGGIERCAQLDNRPPVLTDLVPHAVRCARARG